MSRPVSIIVWRDAKTDPPTKDWKRGVLVMRDDALSGRLRMAVWLAGSVVRDQGRTAPYWAEVPVLSDLTDDDVRDVAYLAEGFLTRAGIAPGSSAHEDIARLRAALGGEKEET